MGGLTDMAKVPVYNPALANQATNRGINAQWAAAHPEFTGQNFYGSIGRPIYTSHAQDVSDLPDWLRNQFQQTTDESGTPNGWSIGGASGGPLRDQNGHDVIQVGDNSSDENIIDWNRVRWDPTLGLVTDPGNRQNKDRGGRFGQAVGLMLAAMAGYVGGGLMGLWGAPEAGMGMLAPGMEGQAALESQLLNQGIMPGTAEWTAAGGGSFGGATGSGTIPGTESIPNVDMPTTPDVDPSRMIDYKPGGNSLWDMARQVYNSPARQGLSWANTLRQVLGSNSSGGGTMGGTGNEEGSGMDLGGILGSLLNIGGSAYLNNRNNNNYRDDINHMIDVGTGGVQSSDRAGARNLVRGLYDGSIDPSTVMDRIPGLAAMRDTMHSDLSRRMSAAGDSDPASSARMREYMQRADTMNYQHYNQELQNAMQIGGFNFNPGTMAGLGLAGLGRIYGNNMQANAGNMAALNRALGGGSGSNSGLMGLLNMFFGRGGGGGTGGDNPDFSLPDGNTPDNYPTEIGDDFWAPF